MALLHCSSTVRAVTPALASQPLRLFVPVQSSSGSAATFDRLSKETSVSIDKVKDDVKSKKQHVVDMLVNYVTTVRLQ